jgi:CheY-like chemotaxis protein
MPTILVVEDEPVLAVAIEIGLREAGYAVLGPIAHLDSALAALTGPPIDAALLDVHLTRGDAVYPVADRLVELRIPFGFMTAYPTDQLVAPYSAHPIVRKPCREADLLKVVENLLRPSPAPDRPLSSRESAQTRSAGEMQTAFAAAASASGPPLDQSERWTLWQAIALGLAIGAIAALVTVVA